MYRFPENFISRAEKHFKVNLKDKDHSVVDFQSKDEDKNIKSYMIEPEPIVYRSNNKFHRSYYKPRREKFSDSIEIAYKLLNDDTSLREIMLDIIDGLSEEYGGRAPVEILKNELRFKFGINEFTSEGIIQILKYEKEIFEKPDGYLNVNIYGN